MAAVAKDPHGGLFQTQNPLTYSPFMIAGSPSDALFVLPHGQQSKIEKVLNDAHLQSRALKFQESYLSPGKIYFGPNGMYWSCFTGEVTGLDLDGKIRKRNDDSTSKEIATIFGPRRLELPKVLIIPSLMLGNGMVLTVTRGSAAKGPPKGEHVITGNISMQHGKRPRRISEVAHDIQFQPKEESQDEQEFLSDFHAQWLQIINAYSGRSLTKQGDKLIAISDIASRVKKDCGFEYLAGL
jgi:hypothetical protein